MPDYDELQKYGTSPFLADSDSDGINDDIELAKGQDPNCPEGKDCGQFKSINSDNSQVRNDSPLFDENTLNLDQVNEASNNAGSIDSQLLKGNISAQELRALLEKNGAPKEMLSQLDDATLLEIYKESLASTSGAVNINSQGAVVPSNDELDRLKSLSADEIRQLMIESGGSEEQLNQLSDDEIKEIFNQTIDKVTSQQ